MLVIGLDDGESATRWEPARSALVRLSELAVPALERAVSRKKNRVQDHWLTIFAAQTLAEIGPQAKRSVTAMLEKLSWLDGRSDPVGMVDALMSAIERVDGKPPATRPMTLPTRRSQSVSYTHLTLPTS